MENNETVLLLHGTSEAAWARIQESCAMTRPFLTCREDVAEYYSECAVDEEPNWQGKENGHVLLAVRVPVSMLLADLPSFDEPLDFCLEDHAEDEDEWHEMIEAGDIPYPDRADWLTSLQFTGSVACAGNVPLASIELFDPQSHQALLADPALLQPSWAGGGMQP